MSWDLWSQRDLFSHESAKPSGFHECSLSSKLQFFSIDVNCMTRRCLPPSMTVLSGLARLAVSSGLTSALNASNSSFIKAKARKTALYQSLPSYLHSYVSLRKDFQAMTSCSRATEEGLLLSPSNLDMSALSLRMRL